MLLVMVWCLISTKPSSEPIQSCQQSDLDKQIYVDQIEFGIFLFENNFDN